MHTKNFIFSVMITSVVFTAGCQEQSVTSAANQNIGNQSITETTRTPDQPIISDAKLNDDTRQTLVATLADERRAQAFYGAVIEKFGDVRPFSNITEAEKKHESLLLPLFEKYGVKVPENEFSTKTQTVPATIQESCQQGVTDEIANKDMYQKFLDIVKEKDIREVFIYLRDASNNNHLPAFERCSQGGGGRGQRRNN